MRRGCSAIGLSLILTVATICGAEAWGGKPRVPRELYQQLLAAQVACDTADEALFGNMQLAGDMFAKFCRTRGFPKTSREIALARRGLYPIANTNPYAKDQLMAREVETHFPEAKTQAEIETDFGLSDPEVDQFQQFPPQSWQSVPGSLIIVQNERDMFVVWAAGIDGKPLRDKNKRIRLVVVHPLHH